MTKAFIDTTVLVNILLKRGDLHDQSLSALRRFDVSETPMYAIKELKAGALYSWIWLHNKCIATHSYAKVLAALHGMARSRKKNLPLTALEAMAELASRNRATLDEMAHKYGPSATSDVVNMDRLRLGLRRRIFSAWRQRGAVASVVHHLPCYHDQELHVDGMGVIDHRPYACQDSEHCSAAKEMAAHGDQVRRLHAATKAATPKLENTRRAHALRHIWRTPNRPYSDSLCRALGDAIFAFFAPSDSVILTTNVSDHRPLAEALGKSVQAP